MSSTFFPVSADSPLALNEPECELSRSARSIQSAARYLESTGQASPSSPTLPSSEAPMSDQLTLFAAGSLARISASQERAPELMATVPGYGESTPELLASFDPDTSSWRTSQRCLVEGWTAFSETWPRSGTMQNGTAYRLQPLALLTDETASGLWPTPRANDAEKRGQIANDKRSGLPAAAMYWPTPTARDYRSGSRSVEGWQKRLADSRGWQLNDVVARFPTPTANRRSGLQSHGVNVILGLLNPMWVEWLMGFPAGWTALSSSATASSRKSRKSSGGQS